MLNLRCLLVVWRSLRSSRYSICQKEDETESENIYTPLNLSTCDGLDVDEYEIKRSICYENEFLPDEYMSHGNREVFDVECVKCSTSPSNSSSLKSINEKDGKGKHNDIPI